MAITTGFNHVATLTADLDRLTDWYARVFDADVVYEMAADGDHPRMAVIDLAGGAGLHVFEVPESEIVGERARIGARGPIDHFGIAVSDRAALEDVKLRLERVGADTGEIQQLGPGWSLFFRDVDGAELEVCADLG